MRRLRIDQAQHYIGPRGELPWPGLNAAGCSAVDAWILRVALNPEAHDLAGWYQVIDQVGGRADDWHDIAIEMPGRATATGEPDTLRLGVKFFDWYVSD